MKKLILFVVLCLQFCIQADVKMPAIFSNNMILQRNTQVSIWGTAEPGEAIHVAANWKEVAKTTADKKGQWQVKLKTPDAGGPYTLIVNGKNRLGFGNVMIGEVWICAGQSNMDCHMEFFKDTKQAIADANYPKIRLFDVRKNYSVKPLKQLFGRWVPCSPQSVKNFSATGYFFGLELYKKLNIPIGLIECAWGGTRIEAWTPWDAQKENPRLKKEKLTAEEVAKSYDAKKEAANYQKAQKEWKTNYSNWVQKGRKGIPPQRATMKLNPLHHKNALSNLYNGMLHPIVPYTIKGIVWYQGEANARFATEYADQLALLVKSWRSAWKQGDFPFYTVQLPGFRASWKTPAEKDASWAILREAFAKVANSEPNCGTAITIDLGNATNIHPGYKNKVGERLARLAFYNDYGKKDIVWSGPVMTSCDYKDNKIIVTFNTGGAPLAAKEGKPIKGFALTDKDGNIATAEAKIIDDNTLEVSSQKVLSPIQIYYAWAMNPEGVNLINKEGLPASPFRDKR